MIDIRKELNSVRDALNSEYISLYDIIESLKKESGATYREIAEYLLLKLLPYEPIPDTFFEEDTGLDAYSYFQFRNSSYIIPYEARNTIYEEADTIHFDRVKDLLSALEFIGGYDIFRDIDYQKITFKVEDIRNALLLDFSEYKSKGIVKKADDEEHKNKSSKPNTITNNNTPDEIARLNAIIEQQAEKIAELEEQLQAQAKLSPIREVVQSAVKSDEIKQYNQLERNTHLQIIGGLVETLASKSFKFKHGCKINTSAIAKAIDEVTADYEDRAKERTIRARLAEALKKISTQHTESS